jgi:hypothetical protein
VVALQLIDDFPTTFGGGFIPNTLKSKKDGPSISSLTLNFLPDALSLPPLPSSMPHRPHEFSQYPNSLNPIFKLASINKAKKHKKTCTLCK